MKGICDIYKYYDNSVCSVMSLVVYCCVICISKQPQYLVHKLRYIGKSKGSTVILKFLNNVEYLNVVEYVYLL